MHYSNNQKQRVYEAFASALNRIAALNREPDEHEGAALLSALSAMATGAYSIAERQINEVIYKRLRQRQQVMPGTATVDGLRAALAQMLTHQTTL